jgi:hypothetical protein
MERSDTGHLAELTRLLWTQRELIGELEYRLEVQQLVMTNGRHDRLHLAVADVESVLDRIRVLEERRLGVVAECAVELGLPVGASLRELIAASPDPWQFALADHQAELLRIVTSTEELAASNRALAARGIEESRHAFATIGASSVTGYGRNGDRPHLELPPTLVDRDA